MESSSFNPDNISKTFCVLPWIHLSTRPNGHMRLCCTANASSADSSNDKKHFGEVGILKGDDGKPANLNQTDLLEGWNNSYMRDVRKKMLTGQIPESCKKCFKEESAGHRSKRNWETEYWSKRIDINKLVNETTPQGEVPAKLYYVDLRLGTKCNLKCIMCSPHDSSLWVDDWEALYPNIENESLKEVMVWENSGLVNGATYDWHKDNPNFWSQLYAQIPHMEQLYFAGGESTIIEDHYRLLQECIHRGYASKIELRYNSNAVVLPDRLFALWKHFKKVRFHYSIDSIGPMNEYIRHPSKWQNTVKNLYKLDDTDPNIEVTIACAVQILNILYIPDFIKWKLEQNFKKINPWPLGAGLINYHFVYHPAMLNVKVLPLQAKLAIEKKYNDFYPWLVTNYRNDPQFLNSAYGISRLKGMISFMKSEDWSNRLPEFWEYIYKMDSIRNTSFQSTFSELNQIMQPNLKSQASSATSIDYNQCTI